MKMLLFIVSLVIGATCVADNWERPLLNGAIAGLNQRLTGEPAQNYLLRMQQQQLQTQQMEYLRQATQVQRLQAEALRQQQNQRFFEQLNGIGSRGGTNSSPVIIDAPAL